MDKPDHKAVWAFAALILMAGANAVAVRFTIRELDPFWSASLRFAAGSAVFFMVFATRKVRMPRGKDLVGDVLYGIMGFGISYALFYWGVQEVPAGVAQVLLALVPLFTIFLAAMHGLERVTARGVAGAVLALVGFAVVGSDQLSADVPLASLIALLIAPVVVAETAVLVKWFPATDPVAKNAIGMGAASILLFLMSWFTGEQVALPSRTDTWVALVYLVLPGSVLVFTLYLYVLSKWKASTASYQFVLFPFSTVIYGAILLDERLSVQLAAGAVLVLAGVYVGAMARTNAQESPVPCLPEQPPEGMSSDRQMDDRT